MHDKIVLVRLKKRIKKLEKELEDTKKFAEYLRNELIETNYR